MIYSLKPIIRNMYSGILWKKTRIDDKILRPFGVKDIQGL